MGWSSFWRRQKKTWTDKRNAKTFFTYGLDRRDYTGDWSKRLKNATMLQHGTTHDWLQEDVGEVVAWLANLIPGYGSLISAGMHAQRAYLLTHEAKWNKSEAARATTMYAKNQERMKREAAARRELAKRQAEEAAARKKEEQASRDALDRRLADLEELARGRLPVPAPAGARPGRQLGGRLRQMGGGTSPGTVIIAAGLGLGALLLLRK